MTIHQFYTYFRSSTSYRLRIALNLKGVTPKETIAINLKLGEHHQAAFQQINAASAVPVFVLDDGAETITQSIAMLEWLDEHFPTPSFLPGTALQRAKIRAFSQVIAAEMHPINNLRVLRYLSEKLNVTDATRQEWIHHWMHQGFQSLQALLDGAPKHAFAFSDQPSLADICLIPQIYNALRFQVDMSAYPQLMRLYEQALTHAAFDAAQPEKQPDCAL